MRKKYKLTYDDVFIVGCTAIFVLRLTSMITRPRVINNYHLHA